MARSNHIRVVFYAPADFVRALKHECVDRNMTMGEIVQESVHMRPVSTRATKRESEKKGFPNGR